MKMAEKYRKKMEESTTQENTQGFKDSVLSSTSNNNRNSVTPSTNQSMGVTPEVSDDYDICPIHKRKIEIISITSRERICSQCALFGEHKNHDIRMEQDVLDEINIRTECLMEMYQIVA